MSPPPVPALSREPTFLAFLPVLCAVWADGLMEDEELDAVSRALDGAAWMTPEGRARVRDWLDPSNPPAPAVFGAAAAVIRSASRNGTLTLTRAGLAVAEADPARAGRGALPWREEAMATLGRVELELGVAGAEALRDITGEGHEAVVVGPRARGLAEEIAPLIHGDHPGLRARVRAALARPELRIPDEIPRGEYRERTLAAVEALAEAGLGAVAYPRAYGGGGDPCGAVAVFEELALGDLSVLVKYGVQFGLFGGSIAQLGTERHHRRYLSRIAALELPGCYAMTETGHGSNVRDLRTTATYDPAAREFVIDTPDDDARKDYIGNAALHGRLATVFARLRVPCGGEDSTPGPHDHPDGFTRPPLDDHGVHAFLVPIRDEPGRVLPGVRIEDCGAKEGLNGVDNGRIWFDGVRVPRDALLDRFAQVGPDGEYHSPIPSPGRRFFTMLGTLIAGRISIAAASQSVAKKALVIAVRYTSGRRQFGPAAGPEVPVLDYLALQRELLPRVARTYAMAFAVRDLIRRYANPEPDRRELEVRAAALKAAASRHALDTLQACREACGGQGYLAENQFARLKADTDVFATFEGANPVLLQLAAKGLLSRYRREMGDLTMWGMARYLAELAGTRLADMNPVVTRRTDPDHLADPDFQHSALLYREERLLRSAARRLKARLDQGMDSFEAVNACQDHLITLARAHVDRIVLEAAHAALGAMQEGDAKALVARVVSLHGLATLERHRAWYLEKGYFESSKSEAIRSEVNRYCAELAPRAVELVDAFGIPDELIEAPIGVKRASP
ncbi:MAG: acyl-CoA dehydrogenase family protein [Gemmatimonadota bacterium]|nr:acyl-CoA dehydrogenase family protein [Gemmatimonadota bacterium]MDE2985848.1 acyl-CoA dehydrogenase family protein [Gemmatimonadota bacterium]